MPPAVSVIINCYNHQDYVGEAIESVLGQTADDLELIIIDNGSTDNCRSVIQRYDDKRIRFFPHDENISLSTRLNEGVRAARGEFVSVLYSDDWLLPHKLEKQLAIFRNLPRDYGVVYSPATGFNQQTGRKWQRPSFGLSGKLMPGMLDRFYDGSIDMCSPLTRRECFLQNPFHDDLFADGEMVFFRIALKWRFQFDPEPLVVLRDHGGNLSKATQKNHDMMIEMFDRLGSHPDFPKEYSGNLRHLIAMAYRNHAWIALRMNSTDDAWLREQLGRGLKMEPQQLLHPRMAGGLILAALPAQVRIALNDLVNRLRPRPESTKLLQDY